MGKPFAMRRGDDGEEEESDGFDLESDTESETASDEFREDPATKVRMNVHGRRIKQPMALPTFEEEEDEADSEDREETKKSRKKKKKKRKRRKKEKKGAVELTHNNDGLMGFNSDELEEDEEVGGGAQMQLDAVDVAQTMQELEMELVPMSHPKGNQRVSQRQRVKPFAMRRGDDGEEEESDGFDLESDTE